MKISMIHRVLLALFVFLVQAALQLAGAAQEQGYIELDDGVGLRYTVILPEGEGPFPVLLQYQGYGAGSSPNDNGISLVSGRWLELGFAIIGVNLRGTGCSEGDFDLFETQWVDDGTQVLDWITAQTWANGDVAMVGLSFPGITQLMVAPTRHPALRAVMPWSALTDLYRDVGYPGGIYNASFATGWTGIQKEGYQYLPNEFAAGNVRCLTAIATQNDPERIVAVFGQTHPWADHFVYERIIPEGSIAKIDVPVIVAHGWQDEQLGSRVTIDYEQLNRDTTWHVYGNGPHGFGLGSAQTVATAEGFLRHFLLGEDNGFETTPHVQISHENAFGELPRWVETFDAWPVATRNAELYFSAAGTLEASREQTAGTFDYIYPMPAPSMTSAAAAQQENQTYQLPIAPGGAAIFTTPPLAHDLELLGPSRVDLWLSSTAPDTDVQISLTEVRPDGQEMFVQRGWLRASHRAMDLRENSAAVPYHLHTEADNTPLTPDEPTLLSIEVWPVSHVFRRSSSLRLRVEAPVGTTGFRQLEFIPMPAVNTVHVGGDTLSRVTLSVLPGGAAPVDYPPCLGQVNQPCRASDVAQPVGELSIPASQLVALSGSGTAWFSGGQVVLSNQTGEPHYLRAVTLDLPNASQLDAASLRFAGTDITLRKPKTRSRFELPEQLLMPGETFALPLSLDAKPIASGVSLGGVAWAGHGESPANVSGYAALLWLGVAFLLAPLLRRRGLILLLLSGVLVSCGGGKDGAAREVDVASSSGIRVLAVEIVDGRGQFQNYGLR